ncbi:hypothetical protein HYQ44_020194 [Verticillium longisporum]|nr:hypothetical protein HYQ44_020194 [Verticillium longisporum]
MQYAALKVLFQRNHKAAFIAIDKQIAECQTFKHYPWLYAFRLLKTTLQTYAGNAPDATHFDNLQMLGNFAYERGDNAIGVLASLLEGLAHLRVMKSDSVERVQTCLAQAAMYQLDPAVKVPQLDILTLLLDLACSMHQKNPDTLVQKLAYSGGRPGWKPYNMRAFSAGFRPDLVGVQACVGFNGTHFRAEDCAAGAGVELVAFTGTNVVASGGACLNGHDERAQVTVDVAGNNCAAFTPTVVTPTAP